MTNLPKITLITGSTDLLVDRALEKVWSALKASIKDINKQEIDATSEDAFAQFADAMSPNLFGSSYLVIVDHINVAGDPHRRPELLLVFWLLLTCRLIPCDRIDSM